jgi:hypothetical protein
MNFERWKNLRGGHIPMAEMDWRHVCMINAVLVSEKPKSVVEFGCWKGFSSSAIIEAMETCPEIERADFLDKEMKPELKAHDYPPRLNVREAPSSAYMGSADFWVLDGDHNAGAIEDYKMACDRNAKTIVIHDTHSFYIMGRHEGARDIGGFLQIAAWYSFLDCAARAGEFTSRGLLIGWAYRPKAETIVELYRLRDASYEELINPMPNESTAPPARLD